MRLRKILALLETAGSFEDMDLPGRRLHPLKGDREGNVYLAVTWAVFENAGKNKQDEIMEKLNEKGGVKENGISEIKEGRLKALRGNYQKPEILSFPKREINNECSDMASCTSSYQSCTNEFSCTNMA